MHKPPRRLALLLVFAALMARPGAALDRGKTLTQYAHRIWGQEEGLFQPTIYSILQTRDGFLWLGTQDSLIRFDGARFREFDGAGETGFHHALIRALLEDDHGNLWVGSLGAGVGKISASGRITRYTTKQGLPSDSVFCLDSKSSDRMWICTNQGLARLENGRFQIFTTADGLPSNQIRSTCQATDGTRWVAGLDFGLSRWNGSRFESYSDPHILHRENVTALACANDGSVWAGTDSGVIQIRQGQSRSFSVRDGLPDNAVSALSMGPDGSLWIGTNDGISRYRNGEFSVYTTRDGLSHSLVLSLYVDREQSLWAGTKDGLDQFTDGKVTPYTTADGMLSNNAGPVLEDTA
jgi:ligand-binding sensor domain-containing protein